MLKNKYKLLQIFYYLHVTVNFIYLFIYLFCICECRCYDNILWSLQIYRWGIVLEGSQESWDVMWQRALKEQSATEVDNLYYGMANVQNAEILKK